MEGKSKISNMEWGLLTAAAFVVDGLQILLDWTTFGIAILTINPFIDVFMSMALPFYLTMRGEKLLTEKKAGGFILSFLLKLLPGVDELPLWGADVLFQMAMSKADDKLKDVTAIKTVSNVVSINRSQRLQATRKQENSGKAA